MSDVKIICGEKCEEDDDVTFTYDKLKRATKKAVLVKVDGESIWLPFSHIVAHDEAEQELRVTNWIASEKGLE